MELTELKNRIVQVFSGSQTELARILEIVEKDRAVFPFRGNKGNEGQMHIKQDNIRQLDPFLLNGDNLEEVIRKAAKRASL